MSRYPFIPSSDWPIIDLCRAGGLAKTVEDHANGQRSHHFHDVRTGQSWGCFGAEEAGRLGVALSRLRGLKVG